MIEKIKKMSLNPFLMVFSFIFIFIFILFNPLAITQTKAETLTPTTSSGATVNSPELQAVTQCNVATIKASLSDLEAQCICNAYSSISHNVTSQLATYCIAYSSSNATNIMETTLLAVDSAAIAACTTACVYPGAVGAAKACNCAGFIDASVNLAQVAMLFSESKKQGIQTDPMNVILGTLGVAFGGPTACIP